MDALPVEKLPDGLKPSALHYLAGVLAALISMPAPYYLHPAAKLHLKQIVELGIQIGRQALRPTGIEFEENELHRLTTYLPRPLRLPVSHVMGWQLPARTYVLLPGYVDADDGGRHFVNADQLAELYGVQISECVVIPFGNLESAKSRWPEDAVKLMPRNDGNYCLPSDKPN